MTSLSLTLGTDPASPPVRPPRARNNMAMTYQDDDNNTQLPIHHLLVNMESILEQQRGKHEERERLVEAMKNEILHKKSTNRDRINSDHRLKLLLDRHQEVTYSLKDLYDDKDGIRKEDVTALSGPNEFAEFYGRLKSIREFHRKHPNQISVPISIEFDEIDKAREGSNEETVMVDFTDEEGYGKYLDLHECYGKYINLKGVEKYDYVTYLRMFDQFGEIPREKKNADYRRYLESLLDYLYDYLMRVRPLTDVAAAMRGVSEEFGRRWEAGTLPGWPREAEGALTRTGAHLELSAFSSWEELASLGLDRLKSALMAMQLKCGGTLEERAQRLFATKGLALSDIPSTLMARRSVAGGGRDSGRAREAALLEARVGWFSVQLSEQRSDTRDNVERRLARTDGEHDDSDGGDQSDSASDDDDDEVPYNPKNLPLGWDGKPIPYWLYKLHGLNISYNCEICGNFVYKGPKSFQRHFAEWRHANGMRCLGIPNTAHFANITQIEDALSLWERLKVQKTANKWQAEAEEEFEDSKGNVVNRKTFEDLKRQGLL